uniref:Uncharacterized protein n=1 Tax=Aegilops tauschii subsp. strangulata TaxID=200361 RepID=A0A453IJP7_AEGTS
STLLSTSTAQEDLAIAKLACWPRCVHALDLTMLENQSQAEVLWPRLVANKLFRKPSGSHAFVADFPAAAGAAEEEFDGCGSPDADAQRCVKRPRPQQRNKTLKYRY